MFYSLLDLLLLRAWHIKRALKKIAARLSGSANVLDAGSGLGQYVWRMARKNRGWKITGIDINREQIADSTEFFNKMGLSRVAFRVADLRISRKPTTTILFYRLTLWNIFWRMKGFQEFYDSMRSNGLLMVSPLRIWEGRIYTTTNRLSRSMFAAGTKPEITENLERLGSVI